MEENKPKTTRILIVEDHSGLRESLAKWVTDLFPDINVSQASTGEEGISLALKICPDIILMDIGLPDINGINATREILKKGLTAKVIIITGLIGEIYREQALEVGAIAFLGKNELNRHLLSTIGRLIGREEEAEGKICFNNML